VKQIETEIPAGKKLNIEPQDFNNLVQFFELLLKVERRLQKEKENKK